MNKLLTINKLIVFSVIMTALSNFCTGFVFALLFTGKGHGSLVWDAAIITGCQILLLCGPLYLVHRLIRLSGRTALSRVQGEKAVNQSVPNQSEPCLPPSNLSTLQKEDSITWREGLLETPEGYRVVCLLARELTEEPSEPCKPTRLDQILSKGRALDLMALCVKEALYEQEHDLTPQVVDLIRRIQRDGVPDPKNIVELSFPAWRLFGVEIEIPQEIKQENNDAHL